MKIPIGLALVAAAAAQLSSEYLPPNAGGAVADFSVPAPSYAAPAAVSFAAPAAVSFAAPAASYAAPAAAAAYESYDVEASAPAHSFSEADGYRYKTQRRRVVKVARRHRRQVSSEYLPPAASAPAASYAAPAASYAAPDASYAAPAASYSAPAAAVESYDVEASAPAHSFSEADGYRYKTQRRRVVKVARRHRRQVSSEYLPPAASAPAASYAAPAASYAAPADAVESYDVEASAPAHSFSDADGYRYKTHRRRVVVRRNRF